jgi:hypothetical protein
MQAPDITGSESLTGASEARVWGGEDSMGLRVWNVEVEVEGRAQADAIDVWDGVPLVTE